MQAALTAAGSLQQIGPLPLEMVASSVLAGTAFLLATPVARLGSEQIGRQLGVSPRAAEGLVYRALRRAQAVAAQCRDDVEDLTTWCPLCGQHRLQATLRPGDGPASAFRLLVRCPGCTPAHLWMSDTQLPFDRYPSLDAARSQSAILGNRRARQWAARAAAGAPPRCGRCSQPLVSGRQWSTPPGADVFCVRMLSWHCSNCGQPHTPVFVHLSMTAAAINPQWQAFLASAPHMRLGPEQLLQCSGEEHVIATALDPDTGRRARLVADSASLAVRSVEIADR